MAAITTVSAASSRQRAVMCDSWPSTAPFRSGSKSSFQPQHQHLAFGVTETHIVFDPLRAPWP